MDDNFKKGHNSGTPMLNHAKHMSCTLTLHMYRVDDLKTVVKELHKKRQRKDDLSPVFAMSPWYLNSGEYRLSNCWHNGTHNAKLNDDPCILCIVVCTCNACSLPSPDLKCCFQERFFQVTSGLLTMDLLEPGYWKHLDYDFAWFCFVSTE